MSRRPLLLLALVFLAGAGMAVTLLVRRQRAELPPVEAPPAAARTPDDVRQRVDQAAAALARAVREQQTAAAVARLAQQPDSSQLARSLYERTSEEPLRRAAIDWAARTGDAPAVRWLAELANADPVNGGRAAGALGAVTNPAAAGALAELLGEHGQAEVRVGAARALGASRATEQAGALGEALAKPAEELRVRQEAALALGQLGGPESVQALAEAFRRSQSDRSQTGEQLRLSIMQGLVRIDSPESRKQIEVIAGGELSPTERSFLVRAGLAAPGGQ